MLKASLTGFVPQLNRHLIFECTVIVRSCNLDDWNSAQVLSLWKWSILKDFHLICRPKRQPRYGQKSIAMGITHYLKDILVIVVSLARYNVGKTDQWSKV
jgi:hypothetical protein